MSQQDDARTGRSDKEGRSQLGSDRATQPDNLGSFFSENKALLKEYMETRMEIYRLQSLRIFSKSAGYFAWIIVSLFLAFLILLFGGVVIGFWFSGMLHSYLKGFALITGLLLLIFILLAVFRKSLFVNPVIQLVIQKSREEEEEE
jgi:hypothetical protein